MIESIRTATLLYNSNKLQKILINSPANIFLITAKDLPAL